MFPRSLTEEIDFLESIGEKEVRYQLAQFNYSGSTHIAEEWLRQKDDERRSLLDRETLKAARDSADAAALEARAADLASTAANAAAASAREQALWAKWSAIIAMTAAIIAAKDQINELITKYL